MPQGKGTYGSQRGRPKKTTRSWDNILEISKPKGITKPHKTKKPKFL